MDEPFGADCSRKRVRGCVLQAINHTGGPISKQPELDWRRDWRSTGSSGTEPHRVLTTLCTSWGGYPHGKPLARYGNCTRHDAHCSLILGSKPRRAPKQTNKQTDHIFGVVGHRTKHEQHCRCHKTRREQQQRALSGSTKTRTPTGSRSSKRKPSSDPLCEIAHASRVALEK